MLARRGTKSPTSDLSTNAHETKIDADAKSRAIGWSNYQPRAETALRYRDSEILMRERLDGGQTRSGLATDAFHRVSQINAATNVLFNWNGYTWDAYDVFGIPTGSSPEAVQAAYEAACRRADNESLPFLEAAYSAIRARHSR